MSKEPMTKEQVLEKVHEINLQMLLALDDICKRHNIKYYLSFGNLIGALRHQDFIPWDNDVDVMITRAEFRRLLPFLKAELDPTLYKIVMPEDFGDKYLDMVPHIHYLKAEIKANQEFLDFYPGASCRIALDFFFLDKLPEGIRGSLYVAHLEFLYGLANAHRLSMNDNAYHGIMKVAAAVLNALGRCFRAKGLRKRILRYVEKYDNDPNCHYYTITNDTMDSFKIRISEDDLGEGSPLLVAGHYFPGPKEADKITRGLFGDYMQLPPVEQRVQHLAYLNPSLVTYDMFQFDED